MKIPIWLMMAALCSPEIQGQMTEYTEVDGIRIAYEAVEGKGPAIVLIHGWSGDRSHWHRQVSGLGGHPLVLLDLPGHGESDKPEMDYTMDLFGRAVEAVLDATGTKEAVLVGHSNGVPVSRQFYRIAPDRVLGIFALDGALRNVIPPATAEWMRQFAGSPDYAEMAASMVDQIPMGDLAADDVERIRKGALDTPVHVHRAGLETMLDPEVWRPDPVLVPMKVIHSVAPQWSEEYLEFVRSLGPQVEVEVWQEVSHFIQLERPEAVTEAIRAFVAGLGPRL